MAYVSCIFQWLLSAMAYGPLIVESDLFKTYVGTGRPLNPVAVSVPAPGTAIPEPIAWLLVGALVIFALIGFVLTVLALYRMPRTVGQGGAKLTRAAAEYVVPVITGRATLKPARRRKLAVRVRWCVKFGLVILPLLLALFSPASELFANRDVYVLVAAAFALWSAFLVALQALAARVLRVASNRVW